MLIGRWTKYVLDFKFPGGTSRGVLKKKTSYFLEVWDESNPEIKGLGEISIIEGLSQDNVLQIPGQLDWLCANLNNTPEFFFEKFIDFPAIRCGLEMAFLDLRNGGIQKYFHSQFQKGNEKIRINGLIWMGDVDFMKSQVKSKLDNGFNCLKLKIGAINFEDEVSIIKSIREEYDEHDLEIRVDANGAFSANEALDKLSVLADLQLHSIEQPIQPNQWEDMARLCEKSELPIALDEELIGVHDPSVMQKMLETINPQYIILKPSLLGGFTETFQWITAAGQMSTPWWITSALESNIGLMAIAQFTGQFYNPLPQGLGTGQLYTNNIDCPLSLKGQQLSLNPELNWDFSNISW